MATVPRSEQRVRAQGALPLQSNRGATAEAFGAMTGQALQGLGQDINQLGSTAAAYIAQVNEENNRRYAKDLDNEYAAYERSVLYGDGTEENPGFLALNGEAAVQARQGVTEALAKKRQELMDSATNDIVREAFRNSATIRDEQTLSTMFRHTNQQREVANDAASEQRVLSSVQDAVLNWNDPSVIDRSSIILTEEMMQTGHRKGYDTATIQMMAKTAQSDMFSRVIKAAMDYDNVKGREIYEKYKHGLSGTDAAVIDEMLEVKDRQVTALKEAQERDSAEAVRKAQEANHASFTVAIARKQFNLTDAVDAAARGEISGSQLQNLMNFASNEDGAGSKPEFNNLLVGIYNGQINTYDDITQNELIDGAQKTSLIEKLHSVQNSGGVLARQDVQNKWRNIDRLIGGQRGLTGLALNESDQVKLAAASEAFNDYILAAPGQMVDDAYLEEAKRRALFAADNLETNDDPISKLRNYPTSKFWTGAKYGDAATLDQQLYAAMVALMEANQRGEISDAEYNRESLLLAKYDEEIKRMLPGGTKQLLRQPGN